MTRKELENKIKYHQEMYYNGHPEISDEEFDVLWDTLRKEFPESNLLTEVGADDIEGEKFPHEIHMGSQDKITSEQELKDWVRLKNIKGDVIVQEKLDGISVELIYDGGKLVRALTRGNSIVGTDITRNIKNLPVASTLKRFSIRGEIILKKSDYQKMNLTEEVFSLRNIASGIAYQKNSSDNLDKLTIMCYDLNIDLPTETNKMLWLRANGFETPEYRLLNLDDNSVMDYLNKKETERDTLDYAIDGMVIKQDVIPSVIEDRVRPNHQRAYKWSSEEKKAYLKDVVWSRNGNNYTPVAIFTPVELAGTMVERASLANIANINKLGIQIPCWVTLTKRGEIIPQVRQVLSVESDSVAVVAPHECDICGNDLVITEARTYCNNLCCASVSEHRLAKWIDTTGALGFGPALLSFLVYDCGITEISDLYCNEVVIRVINKTSKKKATQKAFANLFAVNKMKLEDFVSGFDIPNIGSKVVKLIIDKGHDTLEKLRKVNYSELTTIDGIGPERANIFLEHMILFSDMMDAVIETNRVKIIEGSKVEEVKTSNSGKIFCITGKLSYSRSEFEKEIELAGAKLASGVSKNTSYLVTNTPDSGSSKNVKARELGIPIISEDEFWKIIKS